MTEEVTGDKSLNSWTSMRSHCRWRLCSCRWLRCRFLAATLVFSCVAIVLLTVPPPSTQDLALLRHGATFVLSIRGGGAESNAGPTEVRGEGSNAEVSTLASKGAGTPKAKISAKTVKNGRLATTKPPITTARSPAAGVVTLPTATTTASNGSALPTIYVITPTYKRMEQMADLTRLAQTLMHVPRLHWIVVEDAETFSVAVKDILNRTRLSYTHLLGPKPAVYTKPGKKAVPRGVSNRLAGLKWIKQNANDGVLYFADDDNAYDIRLFEEMRWTKKVSMWPVGLVTQLGVSSPIVKDGKFAGFYDGWVANRKFAVDMAGFAINVAFLNQKKNVTMPFVVGYEEDGFLKSLNVSVNDIEFRADNCSKILVWHTKTMKNKPPKPLNMKDLKKYANTNVIKLYETIR